MTLEFNRDGSLKISKELIKSKQIERESIVLRRVQVNINNPAIAQVRIEYPKDIENPRKIIDYYKQIRNKRFQSVEHTIRRIDKKTFVIEVRNGTKYMYSSLEYLIKCFESKLKTENNIIITGNCDKFS